MSKTKRARKQVSTSINSGKIVRVIVPDEECYWNSEEVRRELETLSAMPDENINTSDIPEITEEQWKRAVPGRWLMHRPGKKKITLRLDADVIAWLKNKKSGCDWMANRILRYEMCLQFKRRQEYAAAMRQESRTRRKAVNSRSKPRRRA